MACGSMGPTTAGRMDSYVELFQSHGGSMVMLAKGNRSQQDVYKRQLRSDLSNLWQAYRNNLQLLNLERQNLITAKDNHDIAMDRYIQGDLSGFEVREAQKSLLDAEERILSAEYNTKLCEISLLRCV